MTKLTEKVAKIEKLVEEGYKVKFYYDLFPLLISPEGELVNIFLERELSWTFDIWIYWLVLLY